MWSVMMDQMHSPAVQAALLACLRASIALAVAADAHGGFLPQPGTELTDEELAWENAVHQRASVQGISTEAAEDAAQMDYQAFYHLSEPILDVMHKECPSHRQITDFCHGPFGGLYETLRDSMGITPQAFLELVSQHHRLTSPTCPGFTATETALINCRADRLPDHLLWS
jgi:hypothetical protein